MNCWGLWDFVTGGRFIMECVGTQWEFVRASDPRSGSVGPFKQLNRQMIFTRENLLGVGLEAKQQKRAMT